MSKIERKFPSKLKCNCCATIRDNLNRKSIRFNPNKEKLSKKIVWIIPNEQFICEWCFKNCDKTSVLCSKKQFGQNNVKLLIPNGIKGKKIFNIKLIRLFFILNLTSYRFT